MTRVFVIIILSIAIVSCEGVKDCPKDNVFIKTDNSVQLGGCLYLNGIYYQSWRFFSDSFDVSGYFGFHGDTLFMIPLIFADSSDCYVKYPIALLRAFENQSLTIEDVSINANCDNLPILPITYSIKVESVEYLNNDTLYHCHASVFVDYFGTIDIHSYDVCPFDFCNFMVSRKYGLLNMRYCRSENSFGIPWLMFDDQMVPGK